MNPICKLFDALNTNGGHIFVGFIMLGIGATFIKIGIPAEGRDLIVAATTLIGRSMIDEARKSKPGE